MASEKCSGCGRSVAKIIDNWDPISQSHIHTRCWLKAREGTRMAEKKPKGFGAFQKLAKKVMAVPKAKVDKRIAEKRDKPTDDPQNK